jgi:hypothetical protein
VSTSATIAGLVGAFGAGTVIATGLKSQLDRVEKFRDRQIQAAEEFLVEVGHARRLSDAAYRMSEATAAASRGAAELETRTAAFAAAIEEAHVHVGEAGRMESRLQVTFNRESLTATFMRFFSDTTYEPAADKWQAVEHQAHELVDSLKELLDALTTERSALNLQQHRAGVLPRIDEHRDKVESNVAKAAFAFNRAVRRRWRV